MRWCARAALCLLLAWTVVGQQECPSGTNSQADVVIILDNSNGVTEAEYNNLRDLTMNWIESQEALSDQSTIHAKVLVVSDFVQRVPQGQRTFSNNHAQTFNDLYSSVGDYVGTENHATNTGVEVAFNDLLQKSSPPGTQKIIVAFTSKDTMDALSLAQAAAFARAIGIVIYPVALKGYPTGPNSEIEILSGATNAERSRIRTMSDPLTATEFPDIPLNLCADIPTCALNNPCQNNGFCVEASDGSLQCDCIGTGFTGLFCETEESNPCPNFNPCTRGVCYLVNGQATCNCTGTGFTGSICSADLDECASVSTNPCLRGQCINSVGSYSCNCTDTGFSGVNCQTDVDECASNICGPGQCFNLVGTYTCNCANTGYTGINCQTDVDECTTGQNPCVNGLCVNLQGSVTCNCANTGYTGLNCQTDIDECASLQTDPCQRGVCQNIAGGATCNCTGTGYTGDTCAQDVDECASLNTNPCQNNGQCINTFGGVSCDCTGTGYQGATCTQDVDECASPQTNPCQNNGQCINTFGSVQCDCTGTGFSGQFCTVDDSNPCPNFNPCTRGVCSIVNGQATCDCTGTGFTGSICSADLDECASISTNPCQRGQCINSVGGYSCNCTGTGYSGVNCQTDVDECAQNVCGPGRCVNIPGRYFCDCAGTGFTGVNCDIAADPCVSSNPCVRGVCSTNSQNQAVCNCSNTGYQGATCDQDVDECAGVPCNSGRCQNLPGSFFCDCAGTRFSGNRCQTAVDACSTNNPCVRGRCFTNAQGQADCDCSNTGFTGPTCTVAVDACATSNPCVRGQCFTNALGQANCDCSNTGFTGFNCNSDIDECASLNTNPCANGRCVNTFGSATCDCTGTAFTGLTCNQVRPVTQAPTTPTNPTQRPTNPTQRPTNPTQRPTNPTQRPTNPTQQPTQPPTGATTRSPFGTTRRPINTTRRPFVTSETTIRPTTQRPPATLRPLQADSICEGSVVILGVGAIGVPFEPESYVLCYFPPATGRRRRRQATGSQTVTFGVTGALAVKKTCPFGSFWNQAERGCSPAGSFTPSTSDPCRADRSLMNRPSINNCRGYFACVNGASVPACCPVGQSYTRFGCAACEGCYDSCSAGTINGGLVSNMVVDAAERCYKQPKWDNPKAYQIVRTGPTYVTVNCPDGEYFNLAACDCQPDPWRNQTQPACLEAISAPTFYPQVIPNSISVGPYTVVTQFGEASFNGADSKVSINAFASYDGPLVIKFRYKETSEITFRQALVSTPVECEDRGNLLVTVDREDVTVEVLTVTGGFVRLRLPTAGFKPDEWKTFQLVDNRNTMTLSLTDGSDAYVTRAAAAAGPYVQCGLDLGFNAYTKGFNGLMDQFSFYQCIPDNVIA